MLQASLAQAKFITLSHYVRLFGVMLCVMLPPLSTISAASAESVPPEPSHQRPVIGVSGSGPESTSVRFIMASLWEAGAYPVLLDIPTEGYKAQYPYLDGLMIAGNSLDINPTDYEASRHELTKDEDAMARNPWEEKRDDAEYWLIERAVEDKLPFLGICSGAQRLNVALGGALVQHVDAQLQVIFGKPPHEPSEQAEILDSQLAAVVALEQLSINSLHHQAIDPQHLPGSLRISARHANKDIVEAVEANPQTLEHPFLIGVQWHPEYLEDAGSKALFKRLVEQAREVAKAKDFSLISGEDQRKNWNHEVLGAYVWQAIQQPPNALRAQHGYDLPKQESKGLLR